MKLLYAAPRYHTNQIPVIEYLINAGHTVEFLVVRKNQNENYAFLSPILCKPSLLYKFCEKIICKSSTDIQIENFRMRYFIPKISELFKMVNTYKPDIVIVRERSLFSICVRLVSIIVGDNKFIVYTQEPCYSKKTFSFLSRLKRFVLNMIMTTKVYSPVLQQCSSDDLNRLIKRKIVYIPFVMKFNKEILERKYLDGGKINILDVGKYRHYKNHFVLIRALSKLTASKLHDINVSIVGQVTNHEEERYYNDLYNMVVEHNLGGCVFLYKNIPYDDMKHFYYKNDVFILTSKREVASISLLEAMANALVCISTDYNGTATYIDESLGYTFKTDNSVSLSQVLIDLIESKDSIAERGLNTFKYASCKFSPDNYFNSILQLAE